MFNAGNYLISIAEVKSFIDDADDIFTEDELDALRYQLAQFPDSGDIIPDTGGVRKIRHGARGQGKRGGARVIYYFRDLNVPVYLLAVYTKGEKIIPNSP
jgi:mRNA-degrading endonuclease RelE of RelBE toxin-antitoxin system